MNISVWLTNMPGPNFSCAGLPNVPPFANVLSNVPAARVADAVLILSADADTEDDAVSVASPSIVAAAVIEAEAERSATP